jgi:hypothetical protein
MAFNSVLKGLNSFCGNSHNISQVLNILNHFLAVSTFTLTDDNTTPSSRLQKLNENLTFMHEHLLRVNGEAAMVMNTI